MSNAFPRSDRRMFLGAISASLFVTPGLFAEQLLRTPSQTEGPFYPDHLPLDTDNDLIIINNSTTPALGEITHLTGRVLSPTGAPMKDVVVEIWQCDGNGVYINSRDSNRNKDKQDANFQGFGKFETNAKGEYRFRTIKPVPYTGRPAPHIHFKVKKGDRELLTSQFFISGHPGNNRDGVVSALNPLERELVTVDFKPIKSSKIGELAANFDIVLGRTLDEREIERRRPGGR